MMRRLYNGTLQRLYKDTDAAVDRLIAANTVGCSCTGRRYTASHKRIHQHRNRRLSRCNLSRDMADGADPHSDHRPLEAITRALSKLAAGSREIRVPELHRGDEIGAMAKAFEIFRANALALEQAQKRPEWLKSRRRHWRGTMLSPVCLIAGYSPLSCKRSWASAERRSPYSVLLVGLDKFKQVNDLHGHAVGDLVLCEVARRLEAIVRSTGGVARLGGDEFAILAKADAGRRRLWRKRGPWRRRVLGAIRAPIMADGKRIEMARVSELHAVIPIARTPDACCTPLTLPCIGSSAMPEARFASSSRAWKTTCVPRDLWKRTSKGQSPRVEYSHIINPWSSFETTASVDSKPLPVGTPRAGIYSAGYLHTSDRAARSNV